MTSEDLARSYLAEQYSAAQAAQAYDEAAWVLALAEEAIGRLSP